MKKSSITEFSFAKPFINILYLDNIDIYLVEQSSIIININNIPLKIGKSILYPFQSSIFSNINITNAQQLVIINSSVDFFPLRGYPHSSRIKETWTHISKIISNQKLKKTKLWRSNKERVNSIEFNLWYADAHTDCGIHNDHNFKEIHTQIFGIGRMQKFHQNDLSTIFQDICMGPGYTHEPFYDSNGNYPWHQYRSFTDCIWLAMEFNNTYFKVRNHLIC